MFLKISALAALIPFASAAIQLTTPTDWASGASANVSWTASPQDPYFSFELVNADIFHNSFGIANNVNPTLGFLTLTLPIVPSGPGYTLQAVNVSNINDIFAQTPNFNVDPTPATVSASSSSVGSSSASLPSGSTTSGVSSSSAASSSASSAASTSSAPSSAGTSSAPSPTVSTFNGSNTSGAAGTFGSIGSWALVAIGAVAGAVVAL
ncbi:hypothetical protein AcV5_005110 [Taiwanofungus camphoratus]|nr:hypothetical protein AcW2_000293 [Antrodia cinnamomea]KAI0937138.1 hypothetical protein AcV5_005110 [Antrodia cinnamomea]KAI0962352.1 hypothetical protein AcV7_001216 [Antrodia cinnamomea]